MAQDFLNSNFGTGIVGVLGAILGAFVGLFGERWVRRIGRVICETEWKPMRTEAHPTEPGGVRVTERWLEVTFLNRKDVDVNVWKMGVEFFREGGKPIEDWERPVVEFVTPDERRSSLGPVNLPSRKPVSFALSVRPDRDDKLPALEEATKAQFVARLDGARDKRKNLKPPWGMPG